MLARPFVALAFERLRQAVVERRVTCETLSEMLVYLRVSLNGAILETLRVSSRPTTVSECILGERYLKSHPDNLEVWYRVLAKLSNERERRLAYLLYHCGLEPAEIVRCCPQEWSDVHEVTRLRRCIFMQLMKRPEL